MKHGVYSIEPIHLCYVTVEIWDYGYTIEFSGLNMVSAKDAGLIKNYYFCFYLLML